MKYLKPPKTFEEQADLLLARGLIADRDTLMARLREVNYYRLSAYWYPLRTRGTDDLLPGITLETVWGRYAFDRQLRISVMDAVERVEISLRSKLINAFVLRHGPFGYLDRANLPGISVSRHRRFLEKTRKEQSGSAEDFVRRYQIKYTQETELPLWMAGELMSFGTLFTLYRSVDKGIQREVAAPYGISDTVLESWLYCLNTARNICAHHGRLWNRVLGNPVMIPRVRKHPDWHRPVAVSASNDRVFAVLTMLSYLLNRIAPQSGWRTRLITLVTEKRTDAPLRPMGFPENWQDCPIWRTP